MRLSYKKNKKETKGPTTIDPKFILFSLFFSFDLFFPCRFSLAVCSRGTDTGKRRKQKTQLLKKGVSE
jgi:hypothetical protein